MSSDIGKRPRTPRADAQRNRDKLLEVARETFTSAESPVSLEGIARDAGVGIGTLYRHFPSREALVEAVYAAELDEVTESAHSLLQTSTPDDALRAWMGRYARFIATKRGMAETLRASWSSGRISTADTKSRITAAIDEILGKAVAEGTLRADTSADDIAALLLGTLLVNASSDDDQQIARLLDLIMDALRPAQR